MASGAKPSILFFGGCFCFYFFIFFFFFELFLQLQLKPYNFLFVQFTFEENEWWIYLEREKKNVSKISKEVEKLEEGFLKVWFPCLKAYQP